MTLFHDIKLEIEKSELKNGTNSCFSSCMLEKSIFKKFLSIIVEKKPGWRLLIREREKCFINLVFEIFFRQYTSLLQLLCMYIMFTNSAKMFVNSVKNTYRLQEYAFVIHIFLTRLSRIL